MFAEQEHLVSNILPERKYIKQLLSMKERLFVMKPKFTACSQQLFQGAFRDPINASIAAICH